MSKYVLTAAIVLAAPFVTGEAFARSTFGGIVYTDVYSINKDKNNNSGGVASGSTADAASFGASRIELPNITRLRASWTNEDDLGLYVEFGIGGASGTSGVNTRQAYGTYKINDRWQVLAGQTSSPFSPLFPEQLIGNNAPASASSSPASIGGGHNTGKGYGDFDGNRNPQVRLTYSFPNQKGAVAVAIMDANQGRNLTLPGALSTAPARDGKLPRIDIGAAFNFYDVRIFPGFSYQKQSYNGVAATSDDGLDTWAGSIGVQTGKGPFEFSAEYNAGRNWRNASYSLGNSAATLGSGAATYVAGGRTQIADSKNQSYWVDLGWRMTTKNTSSTLHLVYGEASSEISDGPVSVRSDNKSKMVGLSWPIETPWMARGLTIRPEVYLYDEGTSTIGASKVDFGEEVIAGVQMQFTF